MPIKTTVSEFLAPFFPDPEEPLWLRTFGPRGAPEAVEYKPVKLRVTRATLVRYKDELKRLNRTRGVYFVVNAGGNTDGEIHRFSSGFCENDTLPIDEQHKHLDLAPIPPSIRIVTQRSVHAHWPLEPGCTETEWRQVQAGLVAHFGGDPKIKNLSRVMRLPYFNHVSINGDGRLHYKRVELVEFDPAKRHSVAELLKAFPCPVVEAAVKSSEPERPASDGAWDELNAEARQRIASHPTARKRPDGWIHCRGICHNGKSDSAIALNPATGAYHCQAGCDTRDIRKAFGLPEEPQGLPNAKEPKVTGLYLSLAELRTAKLPDRQEVMAGIRRGEVTELVSTTHVGKSTLMLNAVLSLLSGHEFQPLVRKDHRPVKVLLIDCESTASYLRHDIEVMKSGLPSAASIDEWLSIWVDGTIHGDPISLDRPEHLQSLGRVIVEQGIGLVVIDTVSAAFTLRNENDNSEVKAKVMGPLANLARQFNCAVVFAHHHGKPNETGTGERAYFGRGASAFGALARTVYTLRRDDTKGDGYVVLECPKNKGQRIPPTLLCLDTNTRWFRASGEPPAAPLADTLTTQEVAAWCEGQGTVKTADIVDAFPRFAKRTVERRVSDAVDLGLLQKAGKGRFRHPPSATLYRDGGLADEEIEGVL